MNNLSYPGRLFRLGYGLALNARCLFPKPLCIAFGRASDQSSLTISRIYIINLDRQQLRWRQMQRELRQVRDRSGAPIIGVSCRVSAIDARDATNTRHLCEVDTDYSLADQLYVDPQPAISSHDTNVNQRIA